MMSKQKEYEFGDYLKESIGGIALLGEENRSALSDLINQLTTKEGLTYEQLLKGKRIAKTDRGYWVEEIAAALTGAMWHHFPGSNRISVISEMIGRTRIQVISLLGLYYQEYQIGGTDEGFLELCWDYETEMRTFFSKFYKRDCNYIYKTQKI